MVDFVREQSTADLDPEAYTIVIRRVVLEGEHVFHGRVVELPDLEAFEPTYEEAYGFLIDGIQTSRAAFEEQGRDFPAPLPQAPEYSGRVTIRMPTWLHARLDFAAQADGISLNQYMVAILASAASPTVVPQTTQSRVPWNQATILVGERGLMTVLEAPGPVVSPWKPAAAAVEAARAAVRRMAMQNFQVSKPTIQTAFGDYGSWRSKSVPEKKAPPAKKGSKVA